MKKMKKILLPLLMCLAMPLVSVEKANGQAQSSFSAQLLAATPSTYLNFNDLTASFRDQMSGLSFVSTYAGTTAAGTIPATLTATWGLNAVGANPTPLVAGMLTSVSVKFYAAPTAGQPITIILLNQSGTSLTVASSFTITTTAATTATQTFNAGTDFMAVAVTAGQLIGFFGTSGSTPGKGTTGGSGFYYLNGQSSLPTGPQTYTFLGGSNSIAVTGTVTTTYTSPAATPRQPGFDNTQPNNTSAAFPYNAWVAAPNNTMGDFEWTQPFSYLIHIDNLQWARSGTKVLFSKGNISSNSAKWLQLYLTMKSATVAQLCFAMEGAGGSAPQNGLEFSMCTAAGTDNPNGFNYDVVVTWDGTGSPSALQLYVNGLAATVFFYAGGPSGFGGVVPAIVGSGTGYANSTAFTSIGGGPNCHVSGTMTSSSGVPASVSVTNATNYGCTSIPTLTLTAPTGTGATLTATLFGATLSTAATAPLFISGSANAGVPSGSDTNPADPPILIDEFAAFPSLLTQSQVQSLFYLTKFYQGELNALPSTPYTLIFDNDGCGDMDNLYALALTIAAQKIGYIRLAGLVDSAGDGYSEALYRQMLDQAGLAHIAVAVPSSFGNTTTLCTAANINTFNSATPQNASSYPSAKTMYRTILATNPTTPVYIILGGSFRGVADLMQSTADSISSLTGAQLVAQNAANGGAIYAQGLGANISFSSDNSLIDWTAGQYVVNNNGSLPIYWYGGVPQGSGPGVLSTRNAQDPLYLQALSFGTDTRYAYDSLPTTSFISSMFAGGVTIAIGGPGTGYAASTNFTSTGGGPNCRVTGTMVSAGGVPASITYTANGTTYTGLGFGCMSTPTIVLTAPTGTGAVLTATPTMSCGTVTITSATSGSTSTATCSNHYFLPLSNNANGGSPYILTWFLNSLIDPTPSGAPKAN